jgi:hypothetical protein
MNRSISLTVGFEILNFRFQIPSSRGKKAPRVSSDLEAEPYPKLEAEKPIEGQGRASNLKVKTETKAEC